MKDSINYQLRTRASGNVLCPSCSIALQTDEVRDLSTPELFTQYTYLAFRQFLRNHEDFHYCLNPACESGQLHTGGSDQPRMTCVTCGFATCINHRIPWHAGRLCDAYELEITKQHEEDERKTAQLMFETVKH